jgi:hypothetical protein
MQTHDSRTSITPIKPVFFHRSLRDLYPLPEASLADAPDMRAIVDQIIEDEILFDARSIPTVGRAGDGEPV